jgi:hemerythrin-like domain-containing protein
LFFTSLLKKDHQAVEALFKKFERAGENAGRLKRQTMDRIIHELSQHAAVEEQVFYPMARKVLRDEEDLVQRSCSRASAPRRGGGNRALPEAEQGNDVRTT